jgi:phage gp29-like protein
MAELDRWPRPGSAIPIRVRTTGDGQPWISSTELTSNIFGGRPVSLAEQTRRYFGAEVTPETIEWVIREAELGYMRDLSDLTKETINCDPHLSSVIGKRFRALASVEPKVVPPEAPADPDRAAQLADQVRAMLRGIPQLRQNVIRLSWAHCNGRAALEKVWSEARGKEYQWDLSELNWIHARRLSFGPRRELRIRDDAFDGSGFDTRGLGLDEIPHKFLWYLPQLFDEYPEREGFGPRALFWSFFKRWAQRDRMTLLELFGKPWRIILLEKDARFDPAAMDSAQARVDEMGCDASAALGPGMTLDVKNPDPKSTEGHRLNLQDCNDEISKLVLGQTNTTDAKAGALGSQQALVHQDGETLVISADGWGISEVLTEGIVRDWVRLNYGESELANAPTIELRYELPPDPDAEIERTTKAISIGLPLRVDEVYERIGFQRPEPGDETVTQEAPAAMPGLPGFPAGRSSSIGVAPGEEADTGDDLAADDPLGPLARASARRLRLSRMPNSSFFARSSQSSTTATTSVVPSSPAPSTDPPTT